VQFREASERLSVRNCVDAHEMRVANRLPPEALWTEMDGYRLRRCDGTGRGRDLLSGFW
jgi:hypothetical protein